MKNIFSSILALLASFSAFATLGPISGTSSICGGTGTTFTNATSGGIWTCSPSTVATIGSSTGVLTAAAVTTTGTATITYSLGAESVYATISVNPTAVITGASAICPGLSTDTFSASITGGYWTCDSVSSDSMAPSGILYIVPGIPGVPTLMTDTVRYILPSGCMSKQHVHVFPGMGVISPASVCAGDTSSGLSWISGFWISGTPSIGTITSIGSFVGVSEGTASLTFAATRAPAPGLCFLNWYTANVYTGIRGSHVTEPPATACVGPTFTSTVCGSTSTYSMTSTFGDGISESSPLGTLGVHSVSHVYALPGTYTIKQKLYDGTTLLDSVTHYYTYAHCNTLPIGIYKDNNSNCTFDAGDMSSTFSCKIQVDSAGVPIDTIPTISGLYYKAYGPAGTVYAFRIIDVSSHMVPTCPSSGVVYDTIYSGITSYSTKQLGLNCGSSSGHDFSATAIANWRPDEGRAAIIVSNTSCIASSPVLTMNFSPKYSFDEASPAPASVVGNIITWNLPYLGASFSGPLMLSAKFVTSGPTRIPGDTVNSSYMVTPLTGDIVPADNQVIRNDVIRGAYDPNDISVSPAGRIPSGTMLTYTVRFENTGNDTAHNIHVMDTISSMLDINSLEMISSSAQMNIAINNIGGQNIVKFDFPNIKLLDSSYHGLCDGIFVFKMNVKDGLSNGTLIPHRVGIYFDANDVVMTNNAEDTIGIAMPPTSLSNSSQDGVTLYPNPARDIVVVDLAGNSYSTLTLTNSIGQVVEEQNVSSNTNALDIKRLPAGIYHVTLRGQNGTIVRRFSKQ